MQEVIAEKLFSLDLKDSFNELKLKGKSFADVKENPVFLFWVGWGVFFVNEEDMILLFKEKYSVEL